MKEFLVTVAGNIYPKIQTYEIRAQNRKKAKKVALKMFDYEYDNSHFDNIEITSAWELKNKEAKEKENEILLP